MKKIKFLNGMSAIFAFATVALATTFTSCEKESLNVDVTPIDAQATISPIVLAVENGVTKDVTSTATVTISPSATFKGNPTLAATTATVTASYNGMSLEVKVAVPALQAGQFASLTPTIILQKEDAETQIDFSEVTTTNEVPADGYVDNTSNYWYYTTASYYEKKGNKKENEEINSALCTGSEVIMIKSFFNSIQQTYAVNKVELKDVPVYAQSRTILKVQYTVVATDYKIYRNTKTKAESVLLASMRVDNYTTTNHKIVPNQQIPGHNHAPAGHGHGHGHGDDGNAGGGIVLPD